jgi:hypothetical protein
MTPSPADLAAKTARLEREPHRAETERDIPTKAAARVAAQSRESAPIVSVTADGAYDGRACRDAITLRGA